MKVLDENYDLIVEDGLGNKLNFDFGSQCCEDFGYFISKDGVNKIEIDLAELSDFNFTGQKAYDDGGKYDDGSSVGFEMKNDKDEVYYFNIYNYHNGYYGHGYQFSCGDFSENGYL